MWEVACNDGVAQLQPVRSSQHPRSQRGRDISPNLTGFRVLGAWKFVEGVCARFCVTDWLPPTLLAQIEEGVVGSALIISSPHVLEIKGEAFAKIPAPDNPVRSRLALCNEIQHGEQ